MRLGGKIVGGLIERKLYGRENGGGLYQNVLHICIVKFSNNQKKKPGVVVHAFIPGTQEADADGYFEFKIGLV